MPDSVFAYPQRLFVLVAGLLLLTSITVTAMDKPAAAQPAGAALLPPAQSPVITERWTLGYTVEGPVTLTGVIGRILDQAAFRSSRAGNIYYVFPPAANRSEIMAARFKINQAEGAYSGQAGLTLEVLDSQTGDLRRVVAVASDGWEETLPGNWVELPLASSELFVAEGEILAAHFQLNGAPGGDLDIRPEFEIDLTHPLSAPAMLARLNSAAAASPNSPTATGEPTLKIWRAGVTIEGELLYDEMRQRLVDTVASFRSFRNGSDIYYAFSTDPAELATVLAAKFQILSRQGSYNGEALLSLEVHSAGNPGAARTLSVTAIDLARVETGVWQPVQLSENLPELELAAGEFLVAHFRLDGEPGGDLDIRPIFEIETAVTGAVDGSRPDLPALPRIYLPVLLK